MTEMVTGFDAPAAAVENVADVAPEARVGAQLRAAREARGLQLTELARLLRLGERQVEALERGDLSGLPGKTFVRGFVRNYARAVQLDAAPLLDLLDGVRELAAPGLELPESTHVTMPGQGRGVSRDMLTVAAGLLLILGAALAYFFLPDQFWVKKPVPDPVALAPASPGEPLFPPAEPAAAQGAEAGAEGAAAAVQETAPAVAAAAAPTAAVQPPGAPAPAAPVAQATGVAPAVPGNPPAGAPAAAPVAAPPVAAPAAPVPGSQPPAAVAAPAAAPVRTLPPVTPAAAPVPAPAAQAAAPAAGQVVSFRFTRDSWVEVRDKDGNLITSRLHPAGSTREITGVPPLSVVVGNASYVQLQYKGQSVSLQPNAESDVARVTLQ